ncbi:MAG TPA: class I SAM-dependent methyltransferase [Flavisolibacter sp.]
MYSTLQLAGKYISYYRRALNRKGHGVHSPFVFDFIRNVLNNGAGYAQPSDVEEIRYKMLRDETLIDVLDLGAGSRTDASARRQVSQIARTALKPEKYASVLYRLVCHYQPQTIIEFGTSLGITTAYMATAQPAAQVITVEGSPSIARLAGKNFEALGLKNVRQVAGDFDQVLPGLLSELRTVDVAYIDGNHRYEPTMRYFHQLLDKRTDGSVLVFDDIHWSREMERAWNDIRQHPEVRYTVDIFALGFVFFRNEFRIKQNFMVRF